MEAPVSESSPLTSLQSQLDEINERIPEQISSRITASTAAIDASKIAPGLAVGDSAPNFTLPDALGRPVTLSELLVDGPVVLTFYRGEWCPFCNLQLRSLQEALPHIRELGANLVAISPQAPDHALSLTEKHDLAYSVLSDLDQAVSGLYRVQFTLTGDLEDLQVNVFQNDPREQNADHSRSLPVPATFVIDRDGVVRAAFVSADWRSRPEPSSIIAALKELR
jgi:peroxiredoxin